MVSTTQRERSDRCSVPPPYPQISFGDADNHPLNHTTANIICEICMKTTLSAKMITFAHGCFGLWQKQSNQKGPTPSIGASPDFFKPG